MTNDDIVWCSIVYDGKGMNINIYYCHIMSNNHSILSVYFVFEIPMISKRPWSARYTCSIMLSTHHVFHINHTYFDVRHFWLVFANIHVFYTIHTHHEHENWKLTATNAYTLFVLTCTYTLFYTISTCQMS